MFGPPLASGAPSGVTGERLSPARPSVRRSIFNKTPNKSALAVITWRCSPTARRCVSRARSCATGNKSAGDLLWPIIVIIIMAVLCYYLCAIGAHCVAAHNERLESTVDSSRRLTLGVERVSGACAVQPAAHSRLQHRIKFCIHAERKPIDLFALACLSSV